MGFYITVVSGPNTDFPNNRTSWCKHELTKNIEFNSEYEVALVQSVFKNVHPTNLGNLILFPDGEDTSSISVHFKANDGERYETIVNRVNDDIYEQLIHQYFKKNKQAYQNEPIGTIPKVILNKETMDFEVQLPPFWKQALFDADNNYIFKSNPYYAFGSEYFHRMRHFFVNTDLVDYQISSKDQLLTDIYLNDVSSNECFAEIKVPRYKKVNPEQANSFFLEYVSSLDSDLDIKGSIVSTLHFRKINGL